VCADSKIVIESIAGIQNRHVVGRDHVCNRAGAQMECMCVLEGGGL
jgi:hypothetical protein